MAETDIDYDGVGARREQKRNEGGKKKEAYNFPVGTTLAYLPPPTPEMRKRPYLEAMMHSKVGAPGTKQHQAICLDEAGNFFLESCDHDAIASRLSSGKYPKKLILNEGCPPCKAITGETEYEACDLGEYPNQMSERREGYLMPFLIMGEDGGRKGRTLYPEVEVKAVSLFASYYLWDGIMEQIQLERGRIMDPDGFILLRVMVTQKGEKKNITVGLDTTTQREPMRLPKGLRALVREEQKPGGTLDVFGWACNMTHEPSTLHAWLIGAPQEKRGGSSAERDGVPKRCYGIETDPADPDCIACEFQVACGKITGRPMPGVGKTAEKKVEPKAATQEIVEKPAEAEPPKRTTVVKRKDPEPPPPEEFVDEDGNPCDAEGNPLIKKEEPPPVKKVIRKVTPVKETTAPVEEAPVEEAPAETEPEKPAVVQNDARKANIAAFRKKIGS